MELSKELDFTDVKFEPAPSALMQSEERLKKIKVNESFYRATKNPDDDKRQRNYLYTFYRKHKIDITIQKEGDGFRLIRTG